MSVQTVLLTILAAIIYMLAFWLPKRLKTVDPEKIDWIKVIRTLIWGIFVGTVLAYLGIEPTIENIQHYLGILGGYGFIVVFVDKATLFIWRLITRYTDIELPI
ncbi:MAG: hypothetical protein ACOC85_05470 [Thermoplasmatota archaeon]